jgi:hypothetical protein
MAIGNRGIAEDCAQVNNTPVIGLIGLGRQTTQNRDPIDIKGKVIF